MMKPAAIVLGALALLGTAAHASPQLDRGVVSGGGGAASSAHFAVVGTLGQPVASSVSATGVDLTGRAGFWSQTLRWLNAVPVAQEDTLERRAGEGGHILVAQLLGNDQDGDWDALHLVSVAASSTVGGTVLRDGPWVVYVPPGGSSADDSFTYVVADDFGGSVSGTVLVRLATAPNTGASPLQIRSVPGPLIEVRFQGIAGRAYRVETAPAVTGPWTNAGTLSANSSGVLLFTESPQPDPRFFRIVEP